MNVIYMRAILINPDKKNLKMPKGLSDSVNRRRTDNTMARRKGTKVHI